MEKATLLALKVEEEAMSQGMQVLLHLEKDDGTDSPQSFQKEHSPDDMLSLRLLFY